MRGKKASLAILLLATLLAAFAATGTAPAVAYTSGAVSGDKITYDGTNWKSLSDAAASGDTVGDVTVDGTLPVTIPEGLKITGSIYNDKGVLLTVNGEQELNVESSDINVRGVFVSGDKSAVSFGNFNSVSVSADNGAGRGLYAGFGGSVSGDLSSVTVKASAGARGIFAYNSDMKLKMNGDMLVSSPNNYADGIRADNGSSVDVSGLKSMTVTAGSGNAEGILTNRSNVSIKMNGDMLVSSPNNYADGIRAYNGSSVDVSGLKSMTVTAGSDNAEGILTNRSNVSLKMNGDMSVSSSNSYADGIWVSNGSSVDISGLKSITVKASSDANSTAVAVAAVIYSKLNLAMDGDTYVSNTSGDNVFGITSELGASLNLAGMKSLVVSSNRGNAYGINAFHSSLSSDLAHLTVTAGSGYADGILTNSSDASLKMNGDMLVSSSNNYANGIWAYNSSSVDVYGLKSMTVTAGNGYADGVKTNSSDASLKMNGDMLVSSSNNYADGIWADNGSSVDVSGLKSMAVSANISNETDYATGASVSKRSKLNLAMDGDMSVHNTGLAYGATADGGSTMNFSGIKAMAVSSDNGTAYGVSASNSSAVNGSLSSMTVQADGNANGVKTDSSDISLNMNGDMSVSSSNGYANGIWVGNNSSGDVAGLKSMTVVANSESLSTTGAAATNGSKLNLAMDGDMNVYNAGGTAYGLYVEWGSTVNSTGMKAMNVTAGSSDAYGIYANYSSVDVAMTGDMTVKGVLSSTAIDAEYGSTVTVTGAARHKIAIDSEVSTDSVLRLSNGSTINVSNADVLNLGKTKVNSITAENYGSRSGSEDIVNASNSDITGNVAFYQAGSGISGPQTGPSFVTGVSSESNGGSLTVNLKDGSTLEGAANAYDGYAPGITRLGAASTPTGAINFNVDNACKWLVTGNSNLGLGTLTNNGTVAFSDDGAFKTFYVNKLAGTNGVYEMRTNGTNSDQIIAETKDSSTSGVIHANFKLGSSATYQKRVATPFITVKNEESTSFTLAGGKFSLGAWNYVLKSGLTAGGETEWHLASDPQNPVSPLALAATAAVVMPDVWYLETNALYSQASSFNADREDTTVWGQAVYNKTEWDNAMSAEGAAAGLVNADGNEVTQKFYGLTGGIDKRIKTDKGQWFAGWMIGYGEGDLDFTGGDGDLDSFHTGLYTVYRTDNDWYLAALAKYNSYKTSVTARANNAAYDGEYTQNGWGLSFLAGKQFVKDSGWYLEPQFELGWHRTAGADYEIYGLPVDVESMTSLRARAGLGFGRKRVYDNGRSLEFFVRASVVKEFDGDTNVRFFADQTKTAFDPFKVDYSGTWGQYKLGLNYYAPDKGFTLHGALTYENGGDRESPIGLELGGSWNIGPKAEGTTEE